MTKRKSPPPRGRRSGPDNSHGKPPRKPANRRTSGGAHWIFGTHAAVAALQNENRRIFEVWATEGFVESHTDELSGFDIKVVKRSELDERLPDDAVHQGIAVRTQPLADLDIQDVLETISNDEKACIAILDQANDPRNIGAVLRSAAAFGVSCLILQDRNAPPETGVMAKAASGALEHVPIVRITNLARTLEALKEAGFWCVGLDGYADATLAEARLDGRTAFVFGAEGRGLRRLTRETCDSLVKIPLSEKVESLNLANAVGITLYEWVR
jgi:23S rRNA (guanosine2251-2'-O)-methyltransferase